RTATKPGVLVADSLDARVRCRTSWPRAGRGGAIRLRTGDVSVRVALGARVGLHRAVGVFVASIFAWEDSSPDARLVAVVVRADLASARLGATMGVSARGAAFAAIGVHGGTVARCRDLRTSWGGQVFGGHLSS